MLYYTVLIIGLVDVVVGVALDDYVLVLLGLLVCATTLGIHEN